MARTARRQCAGGRPLRLGSPQAPISVSFCGGPAWKPSASIWPVSFGRIDLAFLVDDDCLPRVQVDIDRLDAIKASFTVEAQ